MEKIKQNKKYLIIIIIILALTTTVFAEDHYSVSSYDTYTSKTIPFTDFIVNNRNSSDFIPVNTWVALGHSSYQPERGYFLVYTENPYVTCYVTTTSSTAGNVWYISTSSEPISWKWENISSNGTDQFTYNNDYDLYILGGNISYIYYDVPQSFLKVVSSLDEAVADYNNTINPPSSSPNDISFSLPFGNVAYVDLGESSSQYAISRHYTGSAYFPELSNLFNNMFGDDYGTWGYASSLPTSSSQLVAPTTKFEFVKTGSTNLLGQSHNGAWSQTSTASSRYLVLYNPLNLAGGQGDFVTYNFTIPDAYDVKVFPLNTVFNLSNGISSYQETIGDPITGTVDETTGEIVWTDTNGDTSTGPTIGGQNAINNESTSVVDWLKKIANDIVTFLNRSLESVNVLISGGSAFITKIGALYSWLPGPVYSVIISAITLVFAIGVIKVFL